jgi:hypothetical protein
VRMPRIAYPFAVTLTVAVGSACTGAAMPTADPPTVALQPTEQPPVPMPDLAGIVLAPDAPPPGISNDTVVEGTPVLTRVVISGRDAEFLALGGFAAGRYAQFSGDGGLLLSLGLVFDTVGDAEGAFDLFLDELQSDEGYGVGTGGVEAGLGEAGTCAGFDNPALGGLHENACLWRQGTLVLLAGGTLEPDAIHSIAEGMEARASSALAP